MFDDKKTDAADVAAGGREERRLHRQIENIKRDIPALRRPIDLLTKDNSRLIRLPLAALLILGGFFAILPFFGLWMLPLGLLLIAIDIPALQPFVSGMIIRGRKWIRNRRSRG